MADHFLLLMLGWLLILGKLSFLLFKFQTFCLILLYCRNFRLQHTDVDVPHFDIDNHNYVKGALHTIDRAYDKMDPWGLIDFLHHKIGTTHVAHHFDSSIPHYKAQAATDAIAESFPHLYLKEDTPIHKVLWRLARGCTGVVKRGDRWVFDNTGLVDKL